MKKWFNYIGKLVIPARLRRKLIVVVSVFNEEQFQKKLVQIYLNNRSEPQESFDKLDTIKKDFELNKVGKLFEQDVKFITIGILSHIGVNSDLGNLNKCLDGAEQFILNTLYLLVSYRGHFINKSDLSAELRRLLASTDLETSFESFTESLSIKNLLERVIDLVVNKERVAPRFFEIDYLDDIENIVYSRYSIGDSDSLQRGKFIIEILKTLTGRDTETSLSLTAKLRDYLGSSAVCTPPRGLPTNHVRDVIPDLFDEFCACRGTLNPERFLQINLEYSIRQRNEIGSRDSRQLSLLRQYEKDHHILLRALINLIKSSELRASDRILIVGPRYIDEINFFRNILGLSGTIGFDLFGTDCGSIVAGDMHNMPYEDQSFKLVFMCNTLTYAYNARKVISEISRILCPGGFVMIIDSGTRVKGPDPLGRSDMMNSEALIRSFYRRKYDVIVSDRGKSLAPENYAEQPCCLLRLGEFYIK